MRVSATDYLNPCAWPTKSDIGTVKITNADPKLKIKLDLGRRVHFRLDDPNQLLAAKPGNGNAKKLEALVLIVDTTGKVWQRAATIGSITAGNFIQLVPNDPSYGFAVTSADVSFGDYGKSVKDKSFIPFATPLTADQRAQIRLMWHHDPDDPAVVVKVGGPKAGPVAGLVR